MSGTEVRRVIYVLDRDLWVYADNSQPASLADTMASLQRRGLSLPPRRQRQWDQT